MINIKEKKNEAEKERKLPVFLSETCGNKTIFNLIEAHK